MRTKTEAYKVLIAAGWTVEEIEAAFAEKKGVAIEPWMLPPLPPHHPWTIPTKEMLDALSPVTLKPCDCPACKEVKERTHRITPTASRGCVDYDKAIALPKAINLTSDRETARLVGQHILDADVRAIAE